MKQFDERTKANLEVVLEEACGALPHGGDHTYRSRLAKKLIANARKGNTTLTGLTAVARKAAVENATHGTSR